MKTQRWLSFLAAVFLSVLICIPFAWMVVTSVKPYSEIYAIPPYWIVKHPTLQWYKEAIDTGIFHNIWNSFVVAVGSVFATMIFALPTAYAFSRLQFIGKKALLIVLLTSQMLPQILFTIPLFKMFHSMGMLNSYVSLAVSYLVFTVPVGIWMLKGFFDALPKELEEAALIDGCSQVGILWRIALPLTIPAIVSVGIYAFLLSWGEFMFAMTFIQNPAKATLPVALSSFITEYQTRWGILMASSLLATIPALLIFSFLQKYFVKGITEGAVKG